MPGSIRSPSRDYATARTVELALPRIVPEGGRDYQTIAVKGDLVAARQQWRLLAPLMRLVFREHLGAGNDPNWLSIMKATLNMIGPRSAIPYFRSSLLIRKRKNNRRYGPRPGLPGTQLSGGGRSGAVPGPSDFRSSSASTQLDR